MKISHYKIVRENDEYSLYIYLDPSLEEFAGEPNPITKHGYQLTQQIKALIKKKFPKLNIRSTKVMAGSIFIATLSLNPAAFGTKAKAAQYSYQEQHQFDLVVKPSDSLSVIAKKFGTTVSAIMAANHLKSTLIFAGQTLKIPTTSNTDTTSPADSHLTTDTNVKTYTVVSGDSLSLIAKKFNTTVEAIKQLNHLTSDTINIG